MAASSPYTVKTLLLYLENLERREQAAQVLPDSGGELQDLADVTYQKPDVMWDTAENPEFLNPARIANSRKVLRDWLDVERTLCACEAAGHTCNAAGMNQWVTQVCVAHDKLPRVVADWSLDQFCDLAEANSKNSGVAACNGDTALHEGQAEAVAGDDKKRPPVATSKSRSLLLFGRTDHPLINDTEMPILTNAQYDVVLALLNAGEKGLTKDKLDRNSNHGDARKILKRLSNTDANWNSVISFPGKTGSGYRMV